MRKLLILDRFEGDTALIEYTDNNENVVIIKADISSISSKVKEGDVLMCNDGIYSTDYEATEIRREKLNRRLRRMRKNNR
mgnify:CR=1 FL=1